MQMEQHATYQNKRANQILNNEFALQQILGVKVVNANQHRKIVVNRNLVKHQDVNLKHNFATLKILFVKTSRHLHAISTFNAKLTCIALKGNVKLAYL